LRRAIKTSRGRHSEITVVHSRAEHQAAIPCSVTHSRYNLALTLSKHEHKAYGYDQLALWMAWRLSSVGLKTVGINPVPFRTDFSILPARFRIFGQIRIRYGNTGYQIRNRDGNGLTVFPIVFGFPVFVRDIPLLPIRDIPFFCS